MAEEIGRGDYPPCDECGHRSHGFEGCRRCDCMLDGRRAEKEHRDASTSGAHGDPARPTEGFY